MLINVDKKGRVYYNFRVWSLFEVLVRCFISMVIIVATTYVELGDILTILIGTLFCVWAVRPLYLEMKMAVLVAKEGDLKDENKK